MIKIIDPERSVTNDDIAKIEKKYAIPFPSNYKDLLKKYNGGYTEDLEDIDTFLSIIYGKATVELVIETHQIEEKNIPAGFLPIALDWSNNPITISLKDGKIIKYFFDTDEAPELIANSLEELLGINSIDEL